MNVIALDIGGTKIACGIYDDQRGKLSYSTAALGNRAGGRVGDLIADLIKDQVAEAKENARPVSGIGVSIPGIFYPSTGTVWAPNIPDWEAFPLLKLIAELHEFEIQHINIVSDRTCYILGETWLGCAKGCENAIFLAVGTGIGAGILVDGMVLHGQDDIAGAIGWMTLDPTFKTGYKTYGHFEYYASGQGLLRLAGELLQEAPAYTGFLKKGALEELSTHDLFTAYDQNDEIAAAVFERAVSLWGMATANLVSLFNPEIIIFGGGVFGPAIRFLDRIRNEMERWAQPISAKRVRLEASDLGSEAGMAGAAFAALQSISQ